MEDSLEFASRQTPDFILIREAVLIYQALMGARNFDEASDPEKMYLFQMVHILVQTLGTNDLEWTCAAEAVLNCVFGLKSRMAHEYARLFIA